MNLHFCFMLRYIIIRSVCFQKNMSILSCDCTAFSRVSIYISNVNRKSNHKLRFCVMYFYFLFSSTLLIYVKWLLNYKSENAGKWKFKNNTHSFFFLIFEDIRIVFSIVRKFQYLTDNNSHNSNNLYMLFYLMRNGLLNLQAASTTIIHSNLFRTYTMHKSNFLLSLSVNTFILVVTFYMFVSLCVRIVCVHFLRVRAERLNCSFFTVSSKVNIICNISLHM